MIQYMLLDDLIRLLNNFNDNKYFKQCGLKYNVYNTCVHVDKGLLDKFIYILDRAIYCTLPKALLDDILALQIQFKFNSYEF